ncbi:Ubiquitinyl hydrolase 1 protein [Dioscorea alata]|uniref:Ubiquitinyl hydrolase 1 protein n=2 Tax=Dioscorea alata TaxID=55571 RepID=A0ACB7WQJ8_DIOAL|nr:Ubiquitinyl hydrolase 1 protein [Dioscorea alata]KAH7690410.1 Ubiquitinyl hydrolase 1 protein [Dioscorea alata]
MIMWEQDPDVVRWGLHLLSDPFSSTVYCEVPTSNVATFHDGENARECNLNSECTDVENDEIIAHTLQEEFSQVAAAEASGALQEGSDRLQASVLAQDWLGPPMRFIRSDNGGVHGDVYYMEPSSSCSSPGEQPYEGEVWTLELMDDFSSLDGEVGKRLNQLIPVPHVPRINREIPSVDEATSDHQRLIDRLRLYDLAQLKVEGDGNCQFRALSDQLYRTPEHHKVVRKQVVQQLKSHSELYEGYVPMPYGDYLKKIAKSGEWGDHVTLQAAADSYGVKIFVITSFRDTCSIEILPAVQKSKRVIFLSFWAEVHYNSIYPKGELPTMEARRRKKRDFICKSSSYCSLM